MLVSNGYGFCNGRTQRACGAIVCRLLSISRSQFYRLVSSGLLPLVKNGSNRLVLAPDLMKVLLILKSDGISSRARRPDEGTGDARSVGERLTESSGQAPRGFFCLSGSMGMWGSRLS
jgi:hypothetical protein